MFATTILLSSVLVTDGPNDGPVSVPCGLTQPIETQHHGGAAYDCGESQDTGYDAGDAFDITVVTMDGEPVEKDTANAFWVMREAAAADGVEIHINSGFRTMAEQEYFYMCYTCCCCNDCNLAAQPGFSNHQSGHALDLNTSSPGVYNWLAAHGGEYGFTETVPSEAWHWEWWGGGPGGGVCDIAATPTGTLDASACTGITGWAQDPDTPEASIDVHVYFGGPAGDAAAVNVPVLADVQRDDLCEPLGTCNHGFDLGVPLSLQDGAAHPVHVYAIDSAGAANAELASSPQQLQCPRPEIPDGVRRLASADTIAAWGLSTFWRMAMVEQTQIDALEQGTELGSAPLLVRTEAAPELWWVDAGWRRHVPSPEVAAVWGLDLASAQVVTDAILDQWREGTPMRDEPTLVSVDGITIYLVDDAQMHDGSAEDGGDDSGSAGDESGSEGDDTGDTGDASAGSAALPGADGDADDGCGCRSDRSPSGAIGLLVLLLGLRRRR